MNTRYVPEQHDLDELCALFSAADEWGQAHILNTARRQVERQLPALTLVGPNARLDQNSHFLNHPINRRPLTLVCQPVNTE